MKAEDTVMDKLGMEEVASTRYSSLWEFGERIARAQAEITWDIAFKAGYGQREKDPFDEEDRCDKCYKQGIGEVVDWIKNYGRLIKELDYDTNEYHPGFFEVDYHTLLSQLKEWGL